MTEMKVFSINSKSYANSGLKEHFKITCPLFLSIAFFLANGIIIFAEHEKSILGYFFSSPIDHLLLLLGLFQSTLLLSISVFILTYSLFGFIVDDLWKITPTMSPAVPRIFAMYIGSLSVILIISHIEVTFYNYASDPSKPNRSLYYQISYILRNIIIPFVILLQIYIDLYILKVLRKCRNMYEKTYSAYASGIKLSRFLLSANCIITLIAILFSFDNDTTEDRALIIALIAALVSAACEIAIINKISRNSKLDSI